MTEELYMRRCFELAERAIGYTYPNPLVGAVIVHNGEIIGEGYHKFYGGPHAEVNAINSVKEQDLLKESTIYVNLEPCSHYGKTPPCADLIVSKQFKRVVISNKDPFPEVCGRGIKKLEKLEKGTVLFSNFFLRVSFERWKREPSPFPFFL